VRTRCPWLLPWGDVTEMHAEQGEAVMAEHENHLDQPVGEYRLLRQLGKGSFGVVYLADETDP